MELISLVKQCILFNVHINHLSGIDYMTFQEQMCHCTGLIPLKLGRYVVCVQYVVFDTFKLIGYVRIFESIVNWVYLLIQTLVAQNDRE